MRSLVYPKAIVWKSEGMEAGLSLTKPQQATVVNPLVLILSRAQQGQRRKGEGDLPGSCAHNGESAVEALWRCMFNEIGLEASAVKGSPQPVFCDTVIQPHTHSSGGGEVVNVMHQLFAVQVQPSFDVDSRLLTGPNAEHDGRAWLQLVRTLGVTGIESYQNGLAWVYQNGLLVPTES